MMTQSISSPKALYHYRYIILSFLLLLSFLFSCTPHVRTLKYRKLAYTVFLTHPNIKNIDHIAYLVKNGILDVPGASFIALYHSSNRQSYREMTRYLETKKDIEIKDQAAANKYQDIISKLSENSNPVLMIVEMK